MNIIILAGNSLENYKWAEQLKTALDNSAEVSIQDYSHWKSGDKFIDMPKEQKKLIEIANDLDHYIILAKSIGVILAIQSICEQKIKPLKCIFVGTAFNWAKENNYQIEQWLSDYFIETLFIQNEHDPAISFEELKSIISKNNIVNHQLVKLPGDNHKYNANTIAELARSFLK